MINQIVNRMGDCTFLLVMYYKKILHCAFVLAIFALMLYKADIKMNNYQI